MWLQVISLKIESKNKMNKKSKDLNSKRYEYYIR